MIKPLSAIFSPREKTRHRWSVASRTIAGTLGAYAVTALGTVAVSLVLAALGVTRSEAVTAATLASYAVFAVVAMAVFHAASPMRAWALLIGAAVPLSLIVWFLGPAR
ncbi:hypothetical protein EDF56_10787 [Novosphingobium sp. PhB165]|nr:hypothetical protein EDF56_10787 [Novosphingobium sp. PhB165]